MGRTLFEATSNKGTSDKAYTVGYTYNLDGSLAKLTYPSGTVLTYTPTTAGRTSTVSDGTNTYVAAPTAPPMYSAGGLVLGMKNGPSVTTANTYNNRLQPVTLSAETAAATKMSLSYNFHSGAGDNGNIFEIVNNVDSTRNTVYQYDLLNRVSQANTVNTSGLNCWGEVYTVDSWGNLTNRSGPSGMSGGCSTEPLSMSASIKNQLVGISYDAAGNVLNDGNGNAPTYDAENRIVTDAGYTYSYDADGARLEKAMGSSGIMYWLGTGGEVLTETDLTGTINEEYVYLNGARIARVDRPSGMAHLYFSNHLGSASVITDINGNIENQTDYCPYGGICYTSGSDPNRYKFTGKERDAESGNDYFGARYYASTMGRFFTPDWAAKPATVPYAKFGDPQSLNLYGYVENAPINRIDADGHVTSGDFRCPDQRHCVDQSPSGMSSVGQAAVTLSDVPTPSSLGFSTDGMGEWPDWNPHGLPPCLCGEGDSVADTLGKSARRGHSWYNFVYKWGSWGIEADELADELNADKTIRDIAGKVYMNPNQPEWLEIYRLADQNTYLDLARQGAKALDIVPTPTGGAGETVFDLNGKVLDQNNEQIYQLTEQMALRQ